MDNEKNDHTKERFDPRKTGWRIKQRHWHFHQKLYERYGIVLEFGEFSEMMHAIRTEDAELIEFQPGRGAIHCILLRHRWRHIFIATKGSEIVTALPPTQHLKRKWSRLSRR